MRGRVVVGVAALAVTGLVGACSGGHSSFHEPLLSSCEVKTSDNDVQLNPDQAANAATIAAVAIRRQLPDRAVVVAIATALQESKLTNLAGGDRDSIGLFQQRPSQGWGEPKQLSDPRYAAGAFYDHLMRVDGWQDMSVTEAAQAVQRSAHPDEYQKWAAEAETVGTAMVGSPGGAVSCSLHDGPPRRGTTARDALAKAMRLDWGTSLITRDSGSTGLTVPTDGQRSGWQFAHWLVAHAADTGVDRVRYGAKQWTVESGEWRTVKSGQAASDTPAPVEATVYAAKKKSN
ncbi:hypothetical protein [Actinocatenispora rupis]|uniref:Lipoprotein n=1 Tax=Actinocatenispora rupis TaxID=519421 RepID=A0A8J3ND90_9ACTN|nr:hypothetical protein [Actinocatenispora rupis]GID14826.1 hypothetical protein Aru02nite_57150 [Actinocatenispora rupis]